MLLLKSAAIIFILFLYIYALGVYWALFPSLLSTCSRYFSMALFSRLWLYILFLGRSRMLQISTNSCLSCIHIFAFHWNKNRAQPARGINRERPRSMWQSFHINLPHVPPRVRLEFIYIHNCQSAWTESESESRRSIQRRDIPGEASH